MSLLEGEVITEPIVLNNGSGALLIVLPAPAICRFCDRAVRLVINRNGESACVSCDGAVRTSALPPR